MAKIKLCSNPRGCCPTLETNEYGYIITDDFDGTVHLTKDEMKLLIKEVK